MCAEGAHDNDETRRARAAMVTDQLRPRGIRNDAVLDAMGRVPRHLFVTLHPAPVAYEDSALSGEGGQTISQPFIVALMTEALMPVAGERILEIGTGTGYQTAILRTLGAEVDTVERIAPLARAARERLARLGLADRCRFVVADGSTGWPGGGRYSRILVTAAAPVVPPRVAAQLASPGRLVLPVGEHDRQALWLVERDDGGEHSRRLCACAFVPLVGRGGWAD